MTSSPGTNTMTLRTFRRAVLMIFARMAIVVGVIMGLAAMGQVVGGEDAAPAPTHSTPAPAPLPAPVPVGGDGYANHDLFNPSATLDTSTVDDLRTDPEGQCLATDGVMTPERTCVDAIAVWASEVDPGVWAKLRTAGYPRDIDHSTADDTALRVPAEFVILGGEGGEDVLAVDLDRPLTARP